MNATSEQLLDAVEFGETENVRRLLQEDGVNPNVKNIDGMAPLHLVAIYGEENYLVMLKYLIEAGALIDDKDIHVHCPLHIAIFNGHTDMVRVLLEAGADYRMTNYFGETPKYAARKRGHEDIAKLLEEYEKDPDVKEPDCD